MNEEKKSKTDVMQLILIIVVVLSLFGAFYSINTVMAENTEAMQNSIDSKADSITQSIDVLKKKINALIEKSENDKAAVDVAEEPKAEEPAAEAEEPAAEAEEKAEEKPAAKAKEEPAAE